MVTLNKEEFEQMIKNLNKRFQLDENHTVVAIFQDNNHDDIIGWTVVEKGVEADYPMYSTVELFEKYDKTINKEQNKDEHNN